MTERLILTGVAWADVILCWLWRFVTGALVLAGLAGIAAIIYGLRRGDGR